MLQAQPSELQAFLLQTSLLETLIAPLCDVVTGRNDSVTLLAELARNNFFLQPLEGSTGWYRYHALFAGAMRDVAERRFDPQVLRALFTCAGYWYEQQGMTTEAISAALSATEWNQWRDLLEPLVAGQHLTDPHDPHRIRRWLEQPAARTPSTAPVALL